MAIRLFELAGADPARVFSPYCWRTCLALAHKRLAWESIPWRFSDRDSLAPYGSRTVPVLLDGDRAIVDSWTIAGYLERTYADRPSLFGGDAARSATLLIKFWTERTLHPLLARMIVLDIVDVLDPRDLAYFREAPRRPAGRPRGGPGPHARDVPAGAGSAPRDARAAAVRRRGVRQLRRLHRIRHLYVGARGVTLPSACRGRSRILLARPHARPVRWPGGALRRFRSLIAVTLTP